MNFDKIKQAHRNCTGGCSYVKEVNYVEKIVKDSLGRIYSYKETRQGLVMTKIN